MCCRLNSFGHSLILKTYFYRIMDDEDIFNPLSSDNKSTICDIITSSFNKTLIKFIIFEGTSTISFFHRGERKNTISTVVCISASRFILLSTSSHIPFILLSSPLISDHELNRKGWDCFLSKDFGFGGERLTPSRCH